MSDRVVVESAYFGGIAESLISDRRNSVILYQQFKLFELFISASKVTCLTSSTLNLIWFSCVKR
ncbi:hypothetical protein T07_1328 [Trichinella nelsoni]|uniref:Uncharacterized protein n=1 Tax=Trichinella nelsoni TaxID=6336 RepID=A0A0V0RKK8_9BILA|nr:hypothetical protein T07_1328 [Trichinella nelsoni]